MNKREAKLGQYVSRLMKKRGLLQRDVISRAGKEIAGSYLSGIVNGQIENLSMNKFKALARGLGVSAVELFAAASGEPVEQATTSQDFEALDLPTFLDLMQNIAEDDDLMEIVQRIVALRSDERKAILEAVKTLAEVRRKSGRQKKSV